MKTFIILSFAAGFCFASCSSEKKPVSPHETVSGNGISVRYGRPYKKGRVIFGGLVPYGQVYRCGADSATTITFDRDVQFAGNAVKAGTYTVFVIPNEQKWTIILNGQLGQWGAFNYDQNKSKDVLHADVPVKKIDPPIEQLTVLLPPGEVDIEWDNVEVSIPVTQSK